MKSTVKTLVIILLSVTLFSSCEITPDDVANSVRYALETKMEETGVENFEIKKITLEKKTDTEYSGTIETFTEGVTTVAPINVVYTEKQVSWEVDQDNAVQTINMDELSDDMAIKMVHKKLCDMISDEAKVAFDNTFILKRIDKTHFESTIKLFDFDGNETSHSLKAMFDGENLEYEILEM